MRIVHLISSLSKINFGIWNAAFFGSNYLSRAYGVKSIGLICTKSVTPLVDLPLEVHFLGNKPTAEKTISLFMGLQIYPVDTIIVSHGCWLAPSRIAHDLKKEGYRWMYVPHGMLEAWSMQQNKFKKALYWQLIEKRQSRKADVIRAVSENEKRNLEKLLSRNVHLVENGVKAGIHIPKSKTEMVFLFMARLHFKKGIVPLVKAWNTVMRDEPKMKLIIAGPDEGELVHIRPYLGDSLQYVGAVYSNEKQHLLEKAHYYILPSSSEGFPVSVLEAMGFGLIPIITEGCNFPQVFERKLGIKIEPDEDSISSALKGLKEKSFDESLAKRNSDFINSYYSEEKIGEDLYTLYRSILN